MTMDAIVGAWVAAVGGENIIGILLGICFLYMIAFVFYKITS